MLSLAAAEESQTLKETLAWEVRGIDETIDLMHHEVVEEVFECQIDSLFGIASASIGLVDEDADAHPLVEGVIVEQIDTADRLGFLSGLDHET